MKQPFNWDPYSDQPFQLKDRAFKRAMRRRERGSLLRTVLVSLAVLLASLLTMPFLRRRDIDSAHFFGMSVNLDKEPDLTPGLIEELGVDTLLIRFPLWEMERLGDYCDFIRRFRHKRLILNVMQDREHIEDLALLREDLDTLFERFSPYVERFQVGSTINRAKWGFFSVDEYLRFFEVACSLRDAKYPKTALMGPSVIDFEYHFTAHALFNRFRVRYDAVSALLYVDRRGAPENSQMGFDLWRKIRLLAAMMRLSPKSGNELYLTETNWPLTGTAPYAPTSEYECVDEEDYADYLVRYYLIAFATQLVDAVCWHQLIAPGYGLIDNRQGIGKRSAFDAFKTLLTQMKGSRLEHFSADGGSYLMECTDPQGERFWVCWALQPYERTFEQEMRITSRDGKEHTALSVTVAPSPQYLRLSPQGLSNDAI